MARALTARFSTGMYADALMKNDFAFSDRPLGQKLEVS
jgi:hypothetical protein